MGLFDGLKKMAAITSMPINEVYTLEHPFLLDVREPDETAQGVIPGVHKIPLGSLEERLDELPKEETLYVICRSGNRSRRACVILQRKGFDCVNMEGGMKAYKGPTE